MKQNTLHTTASLKQLINENVAVNDDLVCGFCDALIALAKKEEDWDSVAFGYVWKADHYFYVQSDTKKMGKLIRKAEKYINQNKPSELLEKFYCIRHLYAGLTFDLQASFQNCVSALEVSEMVNLTYRIGANYGNVGSYFLDYNCIDDAILYSEKALNIYRNLEDGKPRVMRILLSNLIELYLQSGKPDVALAYIEELTNLPIEGDDLKLYVDNAYLMYYAALKDVDKVNYYYEEIKKDGVLEISNLLYKIELLKRFFDIMLYVEQYDKAKTILVYFENILENEEMEPRLKLCKLKIRYAKQCGTKEELKVLYKEYKDIFVQVDEENRKVKIDGLHTKISLSDAYQRHSQTKKRLKELEMLVNHDELTRIYNRRYLNVKQNEIVNRKVKSNIAISIFDVDYFKEYNDFYGHQAGDTILREVASSMQENCEEKMIVARYGGDEFVCFAWDEDADKMEHFVQQVQKHVKAKQLTHEKSRCDSIVSLSIGYGSGEVEKQTDLLTLFENVDEALYLAKKMGRAQSASIQQLSSKEGGNKIG